MRILKIMLLAAAISFGTINTTHANIFDSINDAIGNIKDIGSMASGKSVSSHPGQMDVLLMKSLQSNDYETDQRAIDNGANVNCYDGGLTPLAIATQKHDFDMANFLLHRGADPEGYIYNKHKYFYIFECNLDMVTFFLDWGVKPTVKYNQNQNLINSIFDRSGTQEQKLELINTLISKGIDINNKENCLLGGPIICDNPTPLMQSIRAGYLNIFHALINAGADITIKDKRGQSALDYAIAYNNKEMINELMTLEGK